jgi:nitrate reductase gamma subunit
MEIMSKDKMRFTKSKMIITALVFAVSFFSFPKVGEAQSGEELFKTKCSACHMLSSQVAMGPGLAGITDKRSEEWLSSWIRNSTEFIATGDADAIAIFEEYNSIPMTAFPELTDENMTDLLAYLAEAAPADTGGGEVATTDSATDAGAETIGPNLTEGESSIVFWSVILVILILFFVWRYFQKTKKRMNETGVYADPHAVDNYPAIFIGFVIIGLAIVYALAVGLENNMGSMNGLLFGALPYVAFGIFIVGSIYRYTKKGYKVSSLSSQFIEGKQLFWGSQPFHWGLLILFFGHLIAFLFPSSVIAFNGHPMRLLILEISSFAFGLSALLGLVLLIKRRLTSKSLMMVTNKMDMVVYTILFTQIITGLGVAFFVRWGSTWFASVLTPYLRSVFSFNPDTEALAAAPVLVQLHVISAFLIIAIIPFTRFMHFLVAPVDYLWRKYQVVIWNWDRKGIRKTGRYNFGKKPKNH